ncbi:hypothetical protein GGH99_004927 [Coemansia sp. RSA 1285]|nr:hypothetical protein GGH99_004927 [Coemansia sp. RSA 1285]
MNSTSYGARLSSYERASTDAGSMAELDGMGSRRVQIQAIPHSNALSSDNSAVPKLSSSSSISSRTAGGIPSLQHSEDQARGGEYNPYDIPSADNGQPMELRHAASMPTRSSDSYDTISSNKSSGLRAALANRFTGKKIKDFRLSVSVSSKRQQHQLESLMSQTKSAEEGGSAPMVPTVRGMPVGHPMSFQHVEHLSPTQLAPKMALINSLDSSVKQVSSRPKLSNSSNRSLASDVSINSNNNNSNGNITNEPSESQPPSYQLHVQPPQPPSERRLNFRNLKPASLMTKASKLSLPGIGGTSSDAGKQNVSNVPSIRGKPISGPSNFQHVEHLSPEEHSMQQFHLLNHRQQQQEIMTMLAQSPVGAGKPRSNTRVQDSKPDKIMYRGLPLSRPLTFEHVEHVSPREYKAHIETKALQEEDEESVADMVSNTPRLSDEAVGRLPDDNINVSMESTALHRANSAGANARAQSSVQQARPRLMALQHTSQNPEAAMAANLSITLNAGGVRKPAAEQTTDDDASDAVTSAQILSAKSPSGNSKARVLNACST